MSIIDKAIVADHLKTSHGVRSGPEPSRRPADGGPGRTLEAELAAALEAGESGLERIAGATPVDGRDAVLTLLRLYDLDLAPVDELGGAEWWQHHPVVAELRWRLERALVELVSRLDLAGGWELPADAVEAVRTVAAADRVPAIYRWLAEAADRGQLLRFLALEGGPDGGFDDLVAACQIGLRGEAKLEMARNYWDEMGRGDLPEVHAELHRRMACSLNLEPMPRSSQPLAALRRAALGPLLATNRALQPEMVGALGLIELQAGPRSRRVAAALRRHGAAEEALAFYDVHAAADPVHGREWLEHVVAPLARERPAWGPRMVRGARWRSALNAHFLAAAARLLGAPGGRHHPGS